MESYREYPIRCKTCYEQLSCFANDYEDLLDTGLSEEEALNNLGIMACCSRIAMVNPTIVAFNMENREVIEGFKSVETANDDAAQNESMARPVFNPCMGTNITGIIPKPLVIGTLPTRVQPNAPGAMIQPAVQQGIPSFRLGNPGMQTITVMQPTRQILVSQPSEVIPASPPGLVDPIISGIEFGMDVEPSGVGIPVQAPDIKQFQEPISVGTPTINPDPTVVQAQVYVGAGKHTRVLNGRTYIAR